MQVAWVLDHLADLASDFSAIHHVPDMGALPGPVLFAFAYRMSAYQGVMALRAADAERDEDGPGSAPERAAVSRAPAAQTVTPRYVLENDSAFRGIFTFSSPAAGQSSA